MDNGQHGRDKKTTATTQQGKGGGTSGSPVVIRQPQGVAGAGVLSQHPVQGPAEAGVKSCCI